MIDVTATEEIAKDARVKANVARLAAAQAKLRQKDRIGPRPTQEPVPVHPRARARGAAARPSATAR